MCVFILTFISRVFCRYCVFLCMCHCKSLCLCLCPLCVNTVRRTFVMFLRRWDCVPVCSCASTYGYLCMCLLLFGCV